MQRNRFAGPHEEKTDGRNRKISGRVIIIASCVLILIAVAALILTNLLKSDNKTIETAPVHSSPAAESSTAVQKPPAEVPQTSPNGPESLFAPDIEIDSIKAEAVDVALQLTQDLPGSKSIALLGDVHLNNGNSTEAVECWRKSLELDPNNAVAFNSMAWIAMQKAEYEKAVDLWQRVIQIDPDLPGVHGALAGALVCLGRSEQAIESLRRDIQLSPKPAHSLVMMANQHVLLNEYEKAKAAFKAAIEHQPNLLNAYYGLANAYARTGEMETSREYMNTFRELKVKEMEALKKRDKAFDDLKSVCREVSETHTAIGRLYLMNNRPAKAEQLLQRAAQLDPENTVTRMILASLYQQTGRNDHALRLYDELIRIEPGRVEHYMGKGICAAMLGQLGTAEKAFQEIIRLYPTQAVGYRELARFYLMARIKPAEALQLIRKAVDINSSAENFYLLSWACEINKDQQGAIKAIRRALELEPNNEDYRKIFQRISQQEK
ncbi:MAG TPA: tetratricopeptide repeat protein [Sedimentisphaerales bacterium]|nr:tetratricopeptide repeat protein [Sedimentisphaerales bacterium]